MLTNTDDFERILYFLSQIQGDQDNFRHSVLQLLHDLFNYNHLTFFISDENGYLVNPIVINMSEKLMDNYIDHYFQTDIFYPTGVNKTMLMEKNVLSISDFMSFEDFEQTDYCRDLLKIDNLFYELALPLKSENKMIGGIGILNTRDQGDFTQRDVILLNYLSKHISTHLNLHLKISKLQYENQVVLDSMRHIPVGVIILNNRLQVLSSNATAAELCRGIFPQKLQPVADVVALLLTRLPVRQISSSAYLETVIDEVYFKMVPFIVPSLERRIDNFYALYLTPRPKGTLPLLEAAGSQYALTEREIEVAKLIAAGLNNKEIAERLVISAHTVKTHVENILKKLDVDRRAAIIHKLSE